MQQSPGIVASMQMEMTLEANWVLERTNIGQAEIAHRNLKLPMTARAVLLMVDGKSEVTQLQRKMAGLKDGLLILESLFNNGLIRRRSYSADAATQAASRHLKQSRQASEQALQQLAQTHNQISSLTQPHPTPVVGRQRRSLALARLYLLDQMERMFGDRSDAARNLLRTATTRADLLSVFADCREILTETAGEERALRIEQEFQAMLPEAVSS